MAKKKNDYAPSFPSLFAVLDHLDAAGFKISKSKLYRDRDKGLIMVENDGSVLEVSVREYALTLERIEGDIGNMGDLHAQKTAREVKSLDVKIAKQTLDLEVAQGKYILRSDFETELAARAVVFESGFRHFFSAQAREFIALVGGKIDKTPDLLQALNDGLDEQLNQYASMDTFQVMFEAVAEIKN